MLLPLAFSTVLEVLGGAVKQEKEIKAAELEENRQKYLCLSMT